MNIQNTIPLSYPALKDSCGCCEGIEPLTPNSLENLPGLSALVYRVGTHSSFKETMKAMLSRQFTALTTRNDNDPSIALLDACATMLDVLTFYQERIANEGYLRTAIERNSVLELAKAIGYQLNPGVAASTFLAFALETAVGSPGTATINIGTKVQSLPGPNETPQIFETVEAIAAQAKWNELKPKLTRLTIPELGSQEVYLKGVTTNLKPGDGLLFIGAERQADSTSERWDFRRVKDVTPNPAAGYTKVTWDEGLGWSRFGRTIQSAQKDFQVYAFRQRAALFGYNAPDWRSMPLNIKEEYYPNEPIIPGNSTSSSRRNYGSEWPNFNIAAISYPNSPVPSEVKPLGLYGEYYDNIDLTTLKLTRIDARINFNWGTGSPDPAITGDTFAVRWTGYVQSRFSETYTFYTLSDDGVRLWVNGQLIIDNWTDHSPTENSGAIALMAGQKYDIKLEYYQRSGSATIGLSWSSPSQRKQIVPQSRLYPPAIDTVYLDAIYSQVLPNSWLILSTPTYQEVYEVETVAEDARKGYTLTAKTTRITLIGENLLEKFNHQVRETVVFAQSERLEIAEKPIMEPLQGDEIECDRLVPNLEPEKILIVSGKRIRAQIISNLLLVAADSQETLSLQPGEVLQVMASPTLQPDGRTRWQLSHNTGFVGFVTTIPGQIVFAPANPEDETVSEVVAIKEVLPHREPTTIVLQTSLKHSFDRSTVIIYGNVARATHGETKEEVLGSGDASQAFQKFVLKQAPLTYVSAPTTSGATTTLKVRVNDILVDEVESLYQLDTRKRAYTTQIADNGKVTVQFGDGITSGARLPTGEENIRATYRVGTGLAGMVKAKQLSLLMTRPLGVQSVINPLAPTGAADPETRDEARQNAPFTVLTLDRIVSLRDFEDFARAFAGIGKSQATWLWDGETRLVHLTVAAATKSDGIDYRVDPQSDLYQNLRLSIDAARDTVQRLRIDSYQPLYFKLEARVLVNRRYISEKVLAAVTAQLQQAFSFAARAFGQAVTESEVLAVIQGVEGVEAADLEKLYLSSQPASLTFRLPAQTARWNPNTKEIEAAQLLILDTNGVLLTEM